MILTQSDQEFVNNLMRLCTFYLKSNHLMLRNIFVISIFICLLLSCQSDTQNIGPKSSDYQDLVELFKEWRKFEKPPLLDGAPDYTAEKFAERWPEFQKLQAKLNTIDYSTWSIDQQVDFHIVWAEMNGYDFNHNVLKPWVRDPAFYKSLWTYRSDVPAHEGPTHHMTTEIWTYDFPLTDSERERLLGDLKVIPPLNEQAQKNLTGNARDLWITGIRDIRSQSDNLKRNNRNESNEITFFIFYPDHIFGFLP